MILNLIANKTARAFKPPKPPEMQTDVRKNEKSHRILQNINETFIHD